MTNSLANRPVVDLDDPIRRPVEIVKPVAALSPFGQRVIEVFDDERQRRAQFVFRVAQILWEICQLEHADMPGFEEDPQAAVEAVVLLDHYDRNRQWSPFPVGTPAAQNRQLQYRLTEVASALLGNAPSTPNSFALVPRPREGWASGRSQPRHTEREVMWAARMGYMAWATYAEAKHYTALTQEEVALWEERATKVLTLAKIHQIDAIRVALLEHQIDPRFSSPSVADVAFGGMTRKL